VPFWYVAFVPLTQLVAGLLVAGSRARRVLAVGIASIALVVPLFLPPEPRWLRAGIGLLLAMTLFRTIDLAKERGERPIAFRLTHVAVPFDTRRIHRGHSPVQLKELATIAAYALLALAAFAILLTRPSALLRWGAGTVLAYAATDVAYGSIGAALRGAGFAIYEFHRTPVAALSVKEFWGERWNRTVMAWFREHIVRPLARRGRTRGGLFASFAASAVLHAYLVIVSVGGTMALLMLMYFLVQAVLIQVETAIRLRERSPLARRAWTVTSMLLSAPLFVEPGLRVLGL
jgi:hypothetical protein